MAIKTKVRNLRSYEIRARITKALAHPSRLFMLDLLLNRDMCVQELTRETGTDQSTVSKHLAILRNAGLLEVRRRGSKAYYRVRCRCVQNFFACIESVIRVNLKDHSETLGF